MEPSVVEKAYAKINLDLYITDVRADGYHSISSFMQTIDLYDEIYVEKSDEIKISCTGKNIPLGPENTMYKALVLMREMYGASGYSIHIEKNIPVCAGLGGPSTDAAAVIRAVNRIEGYNLDASQMSKIGIKIGADVPFLLKGGLAKCEGVGEEITYYDCILPGFILLAKPNISVQTPWAYQEFDRISEPSLLPSNDLSNSLINLDFDGICKYLYNDLEKPVLPKYPIIAGLKKDIKNNGAKAVLMSGSGSTVFGLYENKEEIDKCINYLSSKYIDVEFISTKAVGKI